MSLSRMLAAASAAATLTFALPTSVALAQDLPGFGDSNAMPTGAPFVLPEGLELTIISYNPFDVENTCKRPDVEPDEQPLPEEGLNVGLVRVCFQFRNTTDRPIYFELPPGVIVLSSQQDTQHGLIFTQLKRGVPPMQELFAPIKGDCMNVNRSAPGVGVRYELGPVTDNKDIREALGLMAGADLSDPMVSATASMLMKPLYKGKPLTNDTRRQLMELPRA